MKELEERLREYERLDQPGGAGGGEEAAAAGGGEGELKEGFDELGGEEDVPLTRPKGPIYTSEGKAPELHYSSTALVLL